MKLFEKSFMQRRIKPVVYGAEVNKEFLPQTRTFGTSQTCCSKYLFLFLTAIFLFFSCQPEPEDTAEVVVGNPEDDYTTSPMPENLKGTWTYDWGGGYIEKYIIDETTFTSENTYAGTIVGHRSNSDDEGYITIKFTENFGYVDSENIFYVIHYKDLSISEVTLAGAWLEADPDFEYGVGSGGKTTQAEAEAVMTVSAGYFGMYSTLSRDSK